MMNKPKGYVSPLDRAKDPAVRRRIDEKKREIYLSMLLIEGMKNHKLSVRQLAERAKVSATTIQSIRAGEAENIGLAKLLFELRQDLDIYCLITANAGEIEEKKIGNVFFA